MRQDPLYFFPIVFLLGFGLFILSSVALGLFPNYFLYVIAAVVAYVVFSNIDYIVLSVFSKVFFVFSLLFLALPLILGEVTRGVTRWILLGAFTLQPSELVRPFVFLYFAKVVSDTEVCDFKSLLGVLLRFLPVFVLIVVQPSLGVAIVTAVGVLGILLSSSFPKRYMFMIIVLPILLSPIAWNFLEDYQKQRVISFINPAADKLGAGYNSIQSMIAVGSGQIFGRGFMKGIQTQLQFLPEKHTDFIFASISEELGLVGAAIILLLFLLLFFKMISYMESSRDLEKKMFISGVFLSLLAQTFIHIGMNLSLLPVTGVPLPLVSAGGSSLLATATMLGIIAGISKQKA